MKFDLAFYNGDTYAFYEFEGILRVEKVDTLKEAKLEVSKALINLCEEYKKAAIQAINENKFTSAAELIEKARQASNDGYKFTW